MSNYKILYHNVGTETIPLTIQVPTSLSVISSLMNPSSPQSGPQEFLTI